MKQETIEKKYRLEYKEKTGQFHLDNYTHEENTNGWVTIIDSVTDKEARLFFDFIDYGFPLKIKKYKISKVRYKATVFLRILNLKQQNEK